VAKDATDLLIGLEATGH
jgi:transposase